MHVLGSVAGPADYLQVVQVIAPAPTPLLDVVYLDFVSRKLPSAYSAMAAVAVYSDCPLLRPIFLSVQKQLPGQANERTLVSEVSCLRRLNVTLSPETQFTP